MKRKTILFIFLFGIWGLSLPACRENTADSGEPAAEQPLKEIVYMYPYYGAIPAGQQDVEDAVNEITIPRIHTRVILKPVPNASFAQQLSIALASKEKIDLVTLPDSFMDAYSEGNLLDMTWLLKERGQGILDVIGTYVDSTTINKQVYGITTMSGKAISPHFLLRTDILETLDVDISGIEPVDDILQMEKNLEIIETVFAAVKAQYPEMDILVSSYGELILDRLINYDPLEDSLGVLMGGSSTEVVNLFETQQFKSIVELASKWKKEGYIMSDASVTTASSVSILMAGNAFADIVRTQIGVQAQYKQGTGYDFTMVQMKYPLITSSDNTSVVSVLPVTCGESEAAVDFLNLLYTDKEIVNLMAYGIEGKHYVFMEDGTVDYPEGVTASTSEYPCIQTWFFGNSLLDHVKVGNPVDLYERQAAANSTSPASAAMGFVYDHSPVKEQVEACSRIVAEYKDGLLTGELTADKLGEFNEKLYQAGLNDIIREKQRQINIWLENR